MSIVHSFLGALLSSTRLHSRVPARNRLASPRGTRQPRGRDLRSRPREQPVPRSVRRPDVISQMRRAVKFAERAATRLPRRAHSRLWTRLACALTPGWQYWFPFFRGAEKRMFHRLVGKIGLGMVLTCGASPWALAQVPSVDTSKLDSERAKAGRT